MICTLCGEVLESRDSYADVRTGNYGHKACVLGARVAIEYPSVIVHRDFDGDHENSANCWCRPSVSFGVGDGMITTQPSERLDG